MELRSRRIAAREPHRAASGCSPPPARGPAQPASRNPTHPEHHDDKTTMQLDPRADAQHDGGPPVRRKRAWLAYAVGSGMCAAFNGVFAKLTTTQLTGEMSAAIARALGVSHYEHVVQLLCRAIFFVLNLTFNGIMWTLFTTALKKSSSATQVAVLNSSSNFLVTAFAGMLIFSESLPPMWWAGASLLVAGSVIAGRKDREAEKSDALGLPPPATGPTSTGRSFSSSGARGETMPLGAYRDDAVEEDDDVPDLGGPWTE